MHDEEPESSELASTPGFDGVLEALAAAPRPRVSNHQGVQLPEPLTEAFLNEPNAETPRTPRIGDVIDERYRIEGVLGAGGMGVVFSATHLATGRRVAFKWLQLASMYRTDNEREAALKRFVREAQAAGRIRHPNVVDVYDAGTSPRAPFLVMELLEGESLRARIDRGALSWVDALRVFIPALEGVAEAHRQGVVHRDLKPDNVFLAQLSGGEVCPKVLDFGVSRLHQGDAGDAHVSLTRTGTTLGTPAYMPLEQLRAEGDVDARTDVYALGVMLYEMLTQKRPYVARNAADFAALMTSEKPVPLSRHRPDLRGACERCVMKALERNPADRHQSVPEFAAALRRSERAVGRPFALFSVVALLVLGLGLATWLSNHGTGVTSPDTKASQDARPARPTSLAADKSSPSPSTVEAPPVAPEIARGARAPTRAARRTSERTPDASPRGPASQGTLPAAPAASSPTDLRPSDFAANSTAYDAPRVPAPKATAPTLQLGRDQF